MPWEEMNCVGALDGLGLHWRCGGNVERNATWAGGSVVRNVTWVGGSVTWAGALVLNVIRVGKEGCSVVWVGGVVMRSVS